MTPTGETVINLTRLRAVAARVESAGKTLPGTHEARRETLAPPVGLAPGWAAADAARHASTAWTGFLTRLANTVGRLGTDMTTAANNYTAADANAARLASKAR